jgi:hypothetical protein
VVDLHRGQLAHAEGRLVEDAEEPVARPADLEQLRVALVDLEEGAVGQHHLHADGVRRDLAELARHRGVLGAATAGATDGEIPEPDVDVELTPVLAELVVDVDVEGPAWTVTVSPPMSRILSILRVTMRVPS